MSKSNSPVTPHAISRALLVLLVVAFGGGVAVVGNRAADSHPTPSNESEDGPPPPAEEYSSLDLAEAACSESPSLLYRPLFRSRHGIDAIVRNGPSRFEPTSNEFWIALRVHAIEGVPIPDDIVTAAVAALEQHWDWGDFATSGRDNLGLLYGRFYTLMLGIVRRSYDQSLMPEFFWRVIAMWCGRVASPGFHLGTAPSIDDILPVFAEVVGERLNEKLLEYCETIARSDSYGEPAWWSGLDRTYLLAKLFEWTLRLAQGVLDPDRRRALVEAADDHGRWGLLDGAEGAIPTFSPRGGILLNGAPGLPIQPQPGAASRVASSPIFDAYAMVEQAKPWRFVQVYCDLVADLVESDPDMRRSWDLRFYRSSPPTGARYSSPFSGRVVDWVMTHQAEVAAQAQAREVPFFLTSLVDPGDPDEMENFIEAATEGDLEGYRRGLNRYAYVPYGMSNVYVIDHRAVDDRENTVTYRRGVSRGWQPAIQVYHTEALLGWNRPSAYTYTYDRWSGYGSSTYPSDCFEDWNLNAHHYPDYEEPE